MAGATNSTGVGSLIYPLGVRARRPPSSEVSGSETGLDDGEDAIHQQRQCRRGQRTKEHHARVSQREPGDDGLAQAAGADERRQGRRADGDDSRCPYPP